MKKHVTRIGTAIITQWYTVHGDFMMVHRWKMEEFVMRLA